MSIKAVKSLIPALTETLCKRDCGVVGVVGGSKEYSGGPYYASIAAIKIGVDLVHTICSPEAAPAIKAYSPELIVHPFLPGVDERRDMATEFENLKVWLKRFDSLVIGPGLGRDPATFEFVEKIICYARDKAIPMVIDADGIFLIREKPLLIKGCDYCCITPNKNEMLGCIESMEFIEKNSPSSKNSSGVVMVDNLMRRVADGVWLSNALSGVTVVQKGQVDVITRHDNSIVCDCGGSPKRSGGQGDFLAGFIAAFYAWGRKREEFMVKDGFDFSLSLRAAYGGCTLTRCCAKKAFSIHKRSMTAPDLIPVIGEQFYRLFEIPPVTDEI